MSMKTSLLFILCFISGLISSQLTAQIIEEESLKSEPEIEARNDKNNEVHLSYLYIDHDENLYASSILTAEYIRKEKNNTFVLRLNATERESKIGKQLELDWYHNFKKDYFYVNMALSDKYFPKFKSSFSYHWVLKNAWETETGIRYFYDNQLKESTFFGLLGLTKEVSNFWLNLRYTFKIDSQVKNNLTFQGRMYLNDELDYLTLMGGFGNVPEAGNLNYMTQQTYSVKNTMLGMGYKKTFANKYGLKLNANWYRFQVAEDTKSNQFHLLLSLGYFF